MKQTVRQFLRNMTPEQASSLFGHKDKKQVAKWLAHAQIPFKAADKVLEAMFFEELQAIEPPQALVAPEVIEEQQPEPPQPVETPQQQRIRLLREELAAAEAEETAPTQPLTWADVAAAGPNRPVVPQGVEPTRQIVPGLAEVDPMEQSTQSMTLPGRVIAAQNVPPQRPAPVGPIKIEPKAPQPVPAQTPVVRPSNPMQQAGWVKAPERTPQPQRWTDPVPPRTGPAQELK
jgi:hypothetical protein